MPNVTSFKQLRHVTTIATNNQPTAMTTIATQQHNTNIKTKANTNNNIINQKINK